MPTAADFSLAASSLRAAIADLSTAREPIDGIDDHGVHGGRLQTLVDRALDEQLINLTGLAEALGYALEVAEHRQAVCIDYAHRYSSWQTATAAWDLETREVGPNTAGSRPVRPSPPAAWVER